MINLHLIRSLINFFPRSFSLQNDGESVTKLEKADILELTVRHLHNLRRQNKLYATASAAYADRFKAGFSHCASEVSQFLNKIDRNANAHLMRHLTECMQRVDVLIPSPPPASQPPPPPPSSHQISPMHRVSNSPPITQYYSKEFSLNPHSTILKSDTSVNNNYLQPNHIAPKQECSTFSSTGSNNNNNNNNLDNRPVINYSNKLPKEEPHSGDVWRPW